MNERVFLSSEATFDHAWEETNTCPCYAASLVENISVCLVFTEYFQGGSPRRQSRLGNEEQRGEIRRDQSMIFRCR